MWATSDAHPNPDTAYEDISSAIMYASDQVDVRVSCEPLASSIGILAVLNNTIITPDLLYFIMS